MPFSSRRRWSAVRLDGVTYVLGAPELLPSAGLADRVGEEARSGRRVLGLARTSAPLARGGGVDPPLPAGLELVGVVCLDERGEAELTGQLRQPAHLPVVEIAEQEQDGVGARLLRRPQVLLGREEALREERHGRARPRSAQVVPAAAEALVDEDGDRSGAGRRVLAREPRWVGVRPDVAERGRAPLDLRDRSEARAGERVTKPHS